jgi:hypothetical protein
MIPIPAAALQRGISTVYMQGVCYLHGASNFVTDSYSVESKSKQRKVEEESEYDAYNLKWRSLAGVKQ